MPRDLAALADEASLQGMPKLASTNEFDRQHSAKTGGQHQPDSMSEEEALQRANRRNALHPYTQTLTLSDVDSCVCVEDAAFPPNERATRQKFEYRLKHCGELSMGIFTSRADSALPTAASSAPVYSGTPERRSVLLGHVVATLTTNATVTDDDMDLPGPNNPSAGHKQAGRTLCIHSLAILPDYQGCGLGATLMKAYLQRVDSQRLADRVALIAHDHLVPFYERLGFVSKGQSTAQFGGGGWLDMVRENQNASS